MGVGRALLVGISSGMRCFLAPAVVLSRREGASSPAKAAASACSALELIGDKTPWIGNRVDAGPLAGRVVSGAVCGASVSRDKLAGAVVGGLAAYCSAWTFYRLRREFSQSGVPDLALAVTEDAVAFCLAASATRDQLHFTRL